MKRRTHILSIFVACLFVSACSTLRVEDERETGVAPATAPTAVYVRNFDLQPGNFHAETGILPIGSLSIGGPAALICRIMGVPEDDAIRQRELVTLMSSALVENLRIDGLKARTLAPGESFPSEGWLVRGALVQVDEGNRLRRALVGFGNGSAKLRAVVWVSDLSTGSATPFYVLDTSTHSSRKPGAVFMLDPYVGAERFLIDGLDMETNVTQIAAEIADAISDRSKAGEPSMNWSSKLKRFL